jgi:hypothetical protein
MAATPSAPTPAGDDRNLVAVDANTAITFEEKMQVFWKKRRGAVLAVCVAVIVAMVAKYLWNLRSEKKEENIQKAYAAATTTEQLKSFSAAYSTHPLGGIAELRIADEAYLAGKSADAIPAYEKALGILKTGPLAARAKLGRALAKAQTGKTAEATTELKQLADDANQSKATRGEAGYHLTSLAVGDGNAAEAQKYVDQLGKIDPMGAWSQRASGLRATLPATPAPAAPAAPPPDAEKKDDTSVKFRLPGK